MDVLDIAFLAIMGITTFLGLKSGFVKQITSMVFLLLAFYSASTFSRVFVPEGANFFTAKLYSGITFTIIFLVIFIIGVIIRFLLSTILAFTPATFLDRCLGVFFGALRGTLFGMVMVYVLSFTPAYGSGYWTDSALLPYYESSLNFILVAMSQPETSDNGAPSEDDGPDPTSMILGGQRFPYE